VTVLYCGEGDLIQMPSEEYIQLNDDERLIVVDAINKYRGTVVPTAANMLAVVSRQYVPELPVEYRYFMFLVQHSAAMSTPRYIEHRP